MLFSDIADYVRISPPFSDYKIDNAEGDVLCLSGKNITGRNELNLSKCSLALSGQFEQIDYIQRGDCIIVSTGSLDRIGNYYIYNLPMKAILRTNMIVVRPKIDIDEFINILNRKYFHMKTMAKSIPSPTLNRLHGTDLIFLEVD